MTALDFMMYCAGSGVLLVCGAWSVKILTDSRARVRHQREATARMEEPLDPMNQRLQEIRSAQFGRPMMRTHQTWPVMTPRPRPPAPAPTDTKRTKDSEKKGKQ